MKILRYITGLFYATVLTLSMASCLGSTEEAETVVTDYNNAIVTAFSLENNADVCNNLAGYKFTIDNYGLSDPEIHSKYPDDGIIYNADSLPVGAIADSVKVSLTFARPDSAYFKLYEPWGKLGQFSAYSKDSALYFASYPDCRLTLVARGVRKTYHVKINVHKVTGDTIIWHDYTDELWAGMSNITDQRTDTLNGSYYWYVEENGMTTKVRTASTNGSLKDWSAMTSIEVSEGDILDLSTLYSWRNALYAIGKTSSKLLTTNDGIHWAPAATSHTFKAILGYQPMTKDANGNWNSDSLNTIVKVGEELRFATSANAKDWIIQQEIPAGFPVSGFSRPITTNARSNFGNLTSRLYITGGMTRDGKLVSGTWSCEGWDEEQQGVNWAWFEQNEMPAMYGATVTEYTFNVNKPKSIWILQPGIGTDQKIPANTWHGKLHATLYYSEDFGVSWHRLNRYYSKYADNSPLGLIACNSGFCSDSYQLLYFGGRDDEGHFKTSVWGGQLNSLTFAPEK